MVWMDSQESMVCKIYEEYVPESKVITSCFQEAVSSYSKKEENLSTDSHRRYVHRALDLVYSKVQERLTENNNPATIQPQ
jgi:hypothetical protein